MAIISVNASGEYWNIGNIRPCWIYIKTDDSLATVMTQGYLDNETTLNYTDELMALVKVTEGLVILAVSTANNHISLIAPVVA
ncbi:hypothetical protein [Legionella micdadei]|uniref:Uncharacterized protein n=1 Tax=Legionella micdadei TaxID=451 RepID=A0A098GET1_LEGMI|nr:hypothetical protein [Legionella micdadei]KTD27537.1 hypothetical protein Lmic_1857 [Legionella micdadei]CEG60974.1 protein of unknown function [Legionella micdadei]SCY69829.1 hypothetical protein SAMN02982997_02545 [Legionella micdadei]